MAKRSSRKDDIARLRAVLQRENATIENIDEAVAKAAAEHPEAFYRVTTGSNNA